MTDTQRLHDLGTAVRELRRMHTVYPRPWGRLERAEIERYEKLIDVMLGMYVPDPEQAVTPTAIPPMT